MTLFTRLRLFIRDYCSEFGVAWSMARMRDCERRGGHPFGEAVLDRTLGGFWRVCSRCGTSESVASIGTTFTGPGYYQQPLTGPVSIRPEAKP